MGGRVKAPLVSVIVLNYNGKGHLEACLSSIKRTKYSNFEVILVDNGSSDGSVDLVRKKFKWTKIIANDENLGFAEGNNIGYENSRGKYIVLLNNDTSVDPMWLSEMVKILEKDKKIGACACKVKLFYNRDLLNSAGIELDIYGFAFSRGLPSRNNYEKDTGQYDKLEEVFSAYGAAMMVRRSVIEEVGLFNPDYKMWFEEVDFCWRLRLAGYKIFYTPKAVVYHKLFSTRKIAVFSKNQKLFLERNRLRAMLQNYSLETLIKVLPFYFLLKSSEFLLYLIFRKSGDAQAILNSFLSNLKKLSSIIRERNYVQKEIRKVPDKDVMKYMKRNSVELSLFLKGHGKNVLK